MTDVEFKQEYAGATGWTDRTIWPTMSQPYHVACCDCGLVHDWRFRVIRKARGRDFGGYRPAKCSSRNGPLIYTKRDRSAFRPDQVQVSIDCRRNNTLSARLRSGAASRMTTGMGNPNE